MQIATQLAAAIILGIASAMPAVAQDAADGPDAHDLYAALVRSVATVEFIAGPDVLGAMQDPGVPVDLADFLAAAVGASELQPDGQDYVVSLGYLHECRKLDGAAGRLRCELVVNSRLLEPGAEFESSVIFRFDLQTRRDLPPRVAGPVEAFIAG